LFPFLEINWTNTQLFRRPAQIKKIDLTNNIFIKRPKGLYIFVYLRFTLTIIISIMTELLILNKAFLLISWDVISSAGSIISSFAAITAIIIGYFQFKNTIDRTDEQIAYMKTERNERLEENRPLISIQTTTSAPLKDFWQYALQIDNWGVRPAYDLAIDSTVISVSDDLKNYELSSDAHYKFVNPLSKSISYIGNIYLKAYNTYLIKASIKYTDILNNKIYAEVFYFKWQKIEDKDYNSNILYLMVSGEREKLDEILKLISSKDGVYDDMPIA
jgi:hypothetical protein